MRVLYIIRNIRKYFSLFSFPLFIPRLNKSLELSHQKKKKRNLHKIIIWNNIPIKSWFPPSRWIFTNVWGENFSSVAIYSLHSWKEKKKNFLIVQDSRDIINSMKTRWSETSVKIYYLRIFSLSFEARVAIISRKVIAKLYYGLIGAIKMCGRKRTKIIVYMQ